MYPRRQGMLLMPRCNTSNQAGPLKILLEKGNWAMSTATENKMKGKYDEVAGAAQQVKGHAEQAWGSVKSAANDTAANAKARANESRAVHEDEHERKAHDVRQSVTSTAQNVKNHIQNSVDDFRAKH